jgi:hypothetical protein
MLSVEGDLEHWEMQVLVAKPASVAEIMELTRKQIVSATPHTSSAVTVTQRAPKGTDSAELEWKFTDDLGRGWSGLSVVAPAPDEKGKFVVTLKLALDRRAG